MRALRQLVHDVDAWRRKVNHLALLGDHTHYGAETTVSLAEAQALLEAHPGIKVCQTYSMLILAYR